MTTQTITCTPPLDDTVGTGSKDAAGAGRVLAFVRGLAAWFADQARRRGWVRTLFAATAALAVCVAAVVYTPIEAPISWRNAGSSVSSVRPTPSD
jgi:hypothetical protein